MIRRLALAIVLAVSLCAAAVMPARAGIIVSVGIAPPPLVVYAQPPIPAPGYLWTPGYWAYSDQGYFWVPGTWVLAPFQGALWTPGYWGWANGLYLWHEGYWGLHVGFYGGVNYGYGYGGSGFVGGRWQGGAFEYNRAVMNVGGAAGVRAYQEPVAARPAAPGPSFNGGPGGTAAMPTEAERAEMAVHHLAPQPMQIAHVASASHNPALLASVNHGAPAFAATSRAGELPAPGGGATHGATHGATPAPHPQARASGPAAHAAYPAGQHAGHVPPNGAPSHALAGAPPSGHAPPHASAPAAHAAAARAPQPPRGGPR